jgi:hypothetical protein
VPSIRVLFLSGDEDTWDLHERQDLSRLNMHLLNAGGRTVSFGAKSPSSDAVIDFAMVGLQTSQVAMWVIDGYTDDKAAIAAWAEMGDWPAGREATPES